MVSRVFFFEESKNLRGFFTTFFSVKLPTVFKFTLLLRVSYIVLLLDDRKLELTILQFVVFKSVLIKLSVGSLIVT